MGQVASSLTFSCQGAGYLSAARTGDKLYLQQALTDQPLLLVLASYQGTGLLHLAAQEGHVDVLELLISLIKANAAGLAAAVSRRSKQQQQQQQQDDGEVAQPQELKQREQVLKSRWQLLLMLQPSWPRSKRQLKKLLNPDKVLHTLINWQNERGLTPLMLACRSGHAAAAAVLLQHGADPLLLDRVTRRSCLHYAAVAGHTSCVNLLLSEWRQVLVVRNGAEHQVLLQDVQLRDGVTGTNRFVDLRTKTGFSALHYASYWGHLGSVKALLSAGASVMLQTANGICGGMELLVSRGSNALHLAAGNGHLATAAALLQAHVDCLAEVVPRPISFTQASNSIATPQQQQQQQQLWSRSQQDIPSWQQQQQQRLSWEGSVRLDPRSALNSCGSTPADIAAVLRQPEALQTLLDPHQPITAVLEGAGLSRPFLGVQTLAVIAKAALDQHLANSLNRVETELQHHQQQQQQQCSVYSRRRSFSASKPDHLKADTKLGTAASNPDVITVHCELTPSPSHDDLQGLTDAPTPFPSSSSSSTSGGGLNGSFAAGEGRHHTKSESSCISQQHAAAGSSNSSGNKTIPDCVLEPCPISCASSDLSDSTCGICFEGPSAVMIARCRHCLCVGCARSVVAVTTSSKPAVCPFCRQEVSEFLAAPMQFHA